MQVTAPFSNGISTYGCGNTADNNIASDSNNRVINEADNNTDNIFYHFVGNFIPPEWKDLTGINGKKLTKTARQLLSFIVFRLRLSKSEIGKNEVGKSSADNQSTNNQLNKELQHRLYSVQLDLRARSKERTL